MVEIAAKKGVTLTVKEVKGFVKQRDEDDEFDDWELDAVALTAIVCGDRGPDGKQCYEEAHNEPWGNCSGMEHMHKWPIDGSPQSVRAVDAATDRCYE